MNILLYKSSVLLNYFENVVPNILVVENSENQVDLDLYVIEKETGRANFSMGYNEVHGLTGGGGFDFSNFRGKGQFLSVNYNRGLLEDVATYITSIFDVCLSISETLKPFEQNKKLNRINFHLSFMIFFAIFCFICYIR